MDKIVNNTEFVIDIPDYEGIGVYAIINNRSQKMYIGSSQNVKKRIKQHSLSPILTMKNDIQNGDTFSVEILEMLPYGCNQFDLFEKESFFIQKYDSLNVGYNKAKTTCSSKDELLSMLRECKKDSVMAKYISEIIQKREKPIYKEKIIRNIHIDASLYAEIQQYADNSNKSMNAYIVRAIEEKISHDKGGSDETEK